MAHKGRCFCGAVEIEVEGAPEAMGYCHCQSCRSWSGGPLNAFSLWKPDAVKVTKGSDRIGMFSENADERAAILQDMRRSCYDQPPAARHD